MLAGVGHSGRAEDKARIGAVQSADALQSAYQAGDMSPQNPAIDMGLVQHHVAQVSKKGGPGGMVGQNAHAEHIRIRENDMGLTAHPRAGTRRRVAVICAVAYVPQPGMGGQFVQRAQLILGQRLGGKEIKRPSHGIGQDRFECRRVVAERLAAGGAGDHHYVTIGAHTVDGGCLMGVQAPDATALQGGLQSGVQRLLWRGVTPLTRGQLFHVHHLSTVTTSGVKPVYERLNL